MLNFYKFFRTDFLLENPKYIDLVIAFLEKMKFKIQIMQDDIEMDEDDDIEDILGNIEADMGDL